MNMFDKLSIDERDHITDYIESYGGFGAESLSLKAPLDHILRFWSKNKSDLFNVFGGELILTKKVSFSKPRSMIEDDISNIMDRWGGEGREFYNSFTEWARNQENRYDLQSLLYCETLATNIYVGTSFSVPTADGHTVAVNSGCKVSKVLGKLASAFNLDGYEKFRIAHSLCLNQKTLKGDLCVSIHPLDYMTMSDNECGWSSCMNWREPGDYRQGTVEMMNSPYVVVAYLRSSENMRSCYGHEWNSKKWRQLFIVTPHIITGIRQYPYNSDELNGITLQWLRELAQTNGAWGPYEDTAVRVRNNTNNTIASIGEVYLNFHTHFMYNDFYADHLSYVAPSIPDHYELCFSGETECMQCGEDISDYDECDMESSSLTCNDCECVVFCSECGERVDSSEVIYIDGCKVCPYCYDNHYVECPLCEETHHEESYISVYLRENEDQTSQDLMYHIRVCESCINSPKFIKLFGHTSDIPFGLWRTRSVVDVANVTLDGLEYFEIWDNDDYDRIEQAITSRAEQAANTQTDAGI